LPTLISKDTSDTFRCRENEVEDLRTRSAKRFHIPGTNTYRIGSQIGPVHYQSNPFSETDPWHEINLDVVLTPDKPWDMACETNGYQVRIWNNLVRGGENFKIAAQFIRANRWFGLTPLKLLWTNNAKEKQLISHVIPGITPTINNDKNYIEWANAFGPELTFRYNLSPDKFFKTLVIDSKESLPVPTISPEGLKLSLVLALEWDSETWTGNDFAKDIQTVFGPEESDTPDEHLVDPEVYDHQDERGSVFWVHKPLAWDSNNNSVPVNWKIHRKDENVHGTFSVSVKALNQAVYPVYVDTTIAEESTLASNQDGYGNTNAYRDITSSMVVGKTVYANSAVMLFPNTPIPKGATITSAAVRLCASGTAGTLSLVFSKLYCVAEDNCQPFDATARNACDVTKTADGVVFNPAVWTSLTYYTSPDISLPVQDVINRSGWNQNNNIGVIVADNGTVSGTNTFSIYSWDQGAVYAPKFNCTYTLPYPVASFHTNLAYGNAPLTVQFTDDSSQGTPTSWAWDFDNTGSTDSTSQSPSYTYTTPGVYSVKFTATNASGSTTVINQNYIFVFPQRFDDTQPVAPGQAQPLRVVNFAEENALLRRMIKILEFEQTQDSTMRKRVNVDSFGGQPMLLGNGSSDGPSSVVGVDGQSYICIQKHVSVNPPGALNVPNTVTYIGNLIGSADR
jgi:PKD repeat protein